MTEETQKPESNEEVTTDLVVAAPTDVVAQPEKPTKAPRLTDTEKKKFLAEQKREELSNQQIAERAGVSEATIRRWQASFSKKADSDSAKASPKKKPAHRKKPAAKTESEPAKDTRNQGFRPSRSIVQLRQENEEQQKRIAALEKTVADRAAELSHIKSLAVFYMQR